MRWKQLIKGVFLLVFGAITFFLLFDPKSSGGLEALYATLISATTVGYGDISPSTPAKKFGSAFVLPFLTSVFADFFSPGIASPETDQWDELNKMCPQVEDIKKEFVKGRTSRTRRDG